MLVEKLPKESIEKEQKLDENKEENHVEVDSCDMNDEKNIKEDELEAIQDKRDDKENVNKGQDRSEIKYMTVLVKKSHKIQEEGEKGAIKLEMAQYVEMIVTKWIKCKDIIGVQDVYEEEIIKYLKDYNLWLSEVRTTGKHTLRLEVFFVVAITKGLKEIIDPDRNEYKCENIWIEHKRTRLEYTNKVGFLTGSIVDRVSMEYYDKMIKHLEELEEREVEVKKNTVYKGPEQEWCITVYST